MAARGVDAGGRTEARREVLGAMAGLWLRCMVALGGDGLRAADVIAERGRREGTSGIEERAMRKTQQRESAGE